MQIPARPEAHTPEAGSSLIERRYYDGTLAESLSGDVALARTAYRQVVAASGEIDPAIAGRAALRLASLEARAGRRREGLELAARAEALGNVAGQRDIVDGASALLVRLSSTRTEKIEVGGPALGTALIGVSDAAQERFARAEQLLTAYHDKRLRPRIEALRAAIRQKQYAMDAAVAAYRQVIALGEPRATVAAEFRIGSLHSDLSISFTFDLPSELERSEASRVRRSLTSRALADLRRAREAYGRCIAAAETVDDPAAVDPWRAAADVGLRAVNDLLRGRE